MSTASSIKCPNCGHHFSAEQALEEDIENRLQAKLKEQQLQKDVEYQQREKELLERQEKIDKARVDLANVVNEQVNKKLNEEKQQLLEQSKASYQLELDNLRKLNEDKNNELKLFKQQQLALQQKEAQLIEQQENLAFELDKKLLAERQKIKEEAEAKAQERADLLLKQKEAAFLEKQEQLDLIVAQRVEAEKEQIDNTNKIKMKELQERIEQQNKLVEEMRKKAEQGSMQTQGEAQEKALEETLAEYFRDDLIEEVGKGVRGADCVQIVRNSYGQQCGKILYESKRTKAFANDWITKLKSDLLSQQADVAVIVTETLPSDMTRFGQKDGVWVCTFHEVKSLAFVLRDALIKINAASASNENKADKMSLLYNYLTSNEFSQHISAIVEAFTEMENQLTAEKRAFESMWKKRETQIRKVVTSTTAMYGTVKGIAGGAIQEVKGLGFDELLLE